jgi:hypothetical protein
MVKQLKIVDYFRRKFKPYYLLDISRKECRDVPWNVSTRVLGYVYLISGDVYYILDAPVAIKRLNKAADQPVS